MIKRPKPGETEDDLLEFQKQFLAEKSQPSAHVVLKPGDKRKNTDSTANRTVDRDVVKIGDQPAAIKPVTPAKKSRFKTIQDEKKKQTQETPTSTDDVADSLDASTGTVLTKIIERDTRNSIVQMPAPVQLLCPQLQSTRSGVETKNKKKSLFAQRFSDNPSMFGNFAVPVTPQSQDLDMEEEEAVSDEGQGLIDGSGLSATFGKTDIQKIHQENEDRLSKMTSEDIIAEQQKLIQTLDPKLVEFLRSRKSNKTEAQTETKSGKTDNKDIDLGFPKKRRIPEGPKKTDKPLDVKKEWLNMNKVEYDKLEWMNDLPSPSAGDSNTGQQARFDLKGNFLPANVDISVNVGLHHHGDEPERAGYTLGELFQLARSSNNQQRTLALQVLSRIITQAKSGSYSELIQTPLLPSILDAGVIFLLRWSLDDNTDAVVIAAVAALNSLLVNQQDEVMIDHVFHWGQGHRIVCQAPSEPEDTGIKLPDVSDEKPQETDADVAKRDLILGLVSRMCLLQRLKFILEVSRPQAPTVIAVLQILTRIARHSQTLAYQVYSCPGLMDFIVKNLLPFSWTVEDTTQPISNVYGVPVPAAMRLIRHICQAGKHMASSLVSKFDLTGHLTRYLAVKVSELNLPVTEAYNLQIECLNTWKICLCYGLTDSLYLDLYNVIVDELTTSHKVSGDCKLAEMKLTALIGTLDAVLCIASTEKKPAGFKQSQDGCSMETERSEDVPMAAVNWTHVADLIQPIRALVTNWLEKLSSTYQNQKTSLQLGCVCLTFVTTYYSRVKSQLSSGEMVQVLGDLEDLYGTVIQHWNSPGFIALRSSLSRHSNLLKEGEVNREVSGCLPEYSQTILHGHPHVVITEEASPVSFVSAYVHLVYTMCKEHRGVGTKKGGETTLPSVILQCEYIWSYLRKIARGKFSHLQTNYFTKFEYHLLYYFLKSVLLPGHEEILKSVDAGILHGVSLHLLTGIQYGDEHLVHDLLSTVIYQPLFWQQTTSEKTSASLDELSLSDTVPTQIKSATEQEVGFKQEDLVMEAQSNLLSIRGCYLKALQHFQKPLIQSRHHYLRTFGEVESCLTSKVGESLMPKDWMFFPLIELYNEYASVRSEVQKVLSTSQAGMVSSTLQWIYLLEIHSPTVMNSISVTMKISRIMCTFLSGHDLFLDRRVYCYLAGLLRQYCKPALLDKMDFTQAVPGLTSFYDLYMSLLQHYEAVSFGDWLFGCYILIPLQQKHSLQYRKAIWTEYCGLQRILAVPVNKVLIPIKRFLEPEETNIELIRLYFQSLIGCTLRSSWSPVLYLMAVHHLNRFMYTQDGSHKQLKQSMLSCVNQSKNEELRRHLIYYKKAEVTGDCGMELYESLPPIRLKLINSISTSAPQY